MYDHCLRILREVEDAEHIYPGRKLLAPKTRVCVDFLARELPKRIAKCGAVAKSALR